MRKPNYTLRRIVVGALVFAFIYLLAGYLWWTGQGFCIGSMAKCVGDFTRQVTVFPLLTGKGEGAGTQPDRERGEAMKENLDLRVAYTVRLNAKGKGSIEYIYEEEGEGK